jgi:hypothetical protein
MSGAALAGCASPWPGVPPGGGSPSARQRLLDCADAHGGPAWAALHDVNLAVAGLGSPADNDAGAVQARWLPAAGVLALQGPGSPAAAPAARQAEWLRLWWLGPVAVLDRPGVLNWAEPETLDGRRCDHLHLSGPADRGTIAASQLSLFIDREQGWLRRLRLPDDGGSGGVAELDLSDHQRLHGVLWPRRCQLSRPAPLGGAAPTLWRLTGLDVNRGYAADALAGPAWTDAARPPAKPWPGG